MNIPVTKYLIMSFNQVYIPHLWKSIELLRLLNLSSFIFGLLIVNIIFLKEIKMKMISIMRHKFLVYI